MFFMIFMILVIRYIFVAPTFSIPIILQLTWDFPEISVSCRCTLDFEWNSKWIVEFQAGLKNIVEFSFLSTGRIQPRWPRGYITYRVRILSSASYLKIARERSAPELLRPGLRAVALEKWWISWFLTFGLLTLAPTGFRLPEIWPG